MRSKQQDQCKASALNLLAAIKACIKTWTSKPRMTQPCILQRKQMLWVIAEVCFSTWSLKTTLLRGRMGMSAMKSIQYIIR